MIDANLIEEQPRTSTVTRTQLVLLVVLGAVDHFFSINGFLINWVNTLTEVSQTALPF